MQFQVGDHVVHPMYGVGTIQSWTEQQFPGGLRRAYYVVKTEGATVWVPIDAQGGTVLRGIVARQSLAECRRLLSSAPVHLDKNQRMRQLELEGRLKDGLLPALCKTVRDLRALGAQGSLRPTDDRLLKRIYKALCEEWAAAEGVSEQAAVREIEDLLQDSRAAEIMIGP